MANTNKVIEPRRPTDPKVLSPSKINLATCTAKLGYYLANTALEIGMSPIAEISKWAHNKIHQMCLTKDTSVVSNVENLKLEIAKIQDELRDNNITTEQYFALCNEAFQFCITNKLYEGKSETNIVSQINNRPYIGIIDLIYNNQIYDWKLKMSKPVGIDYEHRTQMGIYSIFTGIEKTNLIYFYLDGRSKKEPPRVKMVQHCFTWDKNKLDKLKYYLSQVERIIDNKAFFPNRSYKWCSPLYCPYWNRCHKDFDGEILDSSIPLIDEFEQKESQNDRGGNSA